MHAAALAQELHLKKVIIPPYPGHFSAWGMLVTQPRLDLVRTRVYRTNTISAAEAETNFTELEALAQSRLAEDGDGEGQLFFQRKADLRYHGQEHTVAVGVGSNPLSVAEIEQNFHTAHERLYTFRLADTPVEFVNFHVAAFQQVRTPEIAPLNHKEHRNNPAERAQRLVDFDVDGVHQTLVYEREQLPIGFTGAGPLIVEEPAATTLVHPGQRLEVDRLGNLVILI
jgi:N-methylhydantoinase A